MKPTYEELLHRNAILEERNRVFESIVSQSPAAILVTDDKGEVIYVNDSTKQKSDEETRREKDMLHNILMENLPLAIAIYDGTGKFLYANERTELLFGLEKGSMPGKRFHEVFPKETADLQVLAMKEVFKSKQPLVVDRNVNMNRRLFNFKVTLQPLLNSTGDVTSVLAIGQDITEQTRQAKILRVQGEINSLSNLTTSLISSLKKAFQYLLEIDWVDFGGIYLYIEDRKKLKLVYSVGLSDDYLKQVSEFPFIHPLSRIVLEGRTIYLQTGMFSDPVKSTMIKEKVKLAVVIPLIYKKEVIGSLNLGSKSVEEINNNDRIIIEYIASRLANLIVLVKTREELLSSNLKLNKNIREKQEQQQKLIQKSRLESLGELSAGLAHEINQPLSVISLVMENISYKLEQKAASEEYLTGKFFTITHNINKIRQLIDHVRIFSRDQGTIMFERVDVNEVISGSLTMIGTQLKNHQIRVILELSKEVGFTLGNPVRFEQVILNLLSNARDALDEKETKLRTERFEKEIRVRSYLEKGNIIIKIRDNGMGIPKDNFEKIFNPFFTTKTEGRGTGLGLAIVYGIISEMRGEIKVDTEEMKCTEITITLKGYKNMVEKT